MLVCKLARLECLDECAVNVGKFCNINARAVPNRGVDEFVGNVRVKCFAVWDRPD